MNLPPPPLPHRLVITVPQRIQRVIGHGKCLYALDINGDLWTREEVYAADWEQLPRSAAVIDMYVHVPEGETEARPELRVLDAAGRLWAYRWTFRDGWCRDEVQL